MIHFHGSPCWPTSAAVALYSGRHACVSFDDQDQCALAFEVCQSVMLDNGAFALWKRGGSIDVPAYAAWVREWHRHPAFAFAIIPDSIDGGLDENRRLIAQWFSERIPGGVPVFHLDEPIDYLQYLMTAYDTIALGSSGKYATPGSDDWWGRISELMEVICDEHGRPKVRLHGLRMLAPTIYSHLPLSSADSCNVARSITMDKRWTGSYQPVTRAQRALVLAERIESHVAAARWNRPEYGTQMNSELIG